MEDGRLVTPACSLWGKLPNWNWVPAGLAYPAKDLIGVHGTMKALKSQFANRGELYERFDRVKYPLAYQDLA